MSLELDGALHRRVLGQHTAARGLARQREKGLLGWYGIPAAHRARSDRTADDIRVP